MTTSNNFTAQDILNQHVQNKAVFTAYRFVGAKDGQQKQTALEFAQQAGGVLFEFSPVKSNDKKQFQELLNQSSFKSTLRQFFIIDNADKLQPSNFSLLLKAIEEAVNKTFVLIDNADALPSTLISRCITLRFTPTAPEPTAVDVGPFADKLPERVKLLTYVNLRGKEEREDVENFLNELLRKAKTAFPENAKVWSQRLQLITQAQNYLAKNVNKKAILDNLAFKW